MTAEERIAILEANERTIFNQLEETKRDIRVLLELTRAVQKIADKTENTASMLEKVDTRLAKIERASAEDFSHYKRTFFGAVISGTVGILLGAVLGYFIN